MPLIFNGYNENKTFVLLILFYISGEYWDYVTVRPKAHMFYWLYETTHESGFKKRPLILWLQVSFYEKKSD